LILPDSIYIADSENNAIRKVNVVTGEITSVAGNGSALYGGEDRALPSPDSTSRIQYPSMVQGTCFSPIGWILRIREVRSNVVYLKYPTMKEGKYLHLSFRNWKRWKCHTSADRSNGATRYK